MQIERLHNKYFWGVLTIVLSLLHFIVIDPFYLELAQITLTISFVGFTMKAFDLEPWSGGECNLENLD